MNIIQYCSIPQYLFSFDDNSTYSKNQQMIFYENNNSTTAVLEKGKLTIKNLTKIKKHTSDPSTTPSLTQTTVMMMTQCLHKT